MKTTDENEQAIANYTGPVTRYPAGKTSKRTTEKKPDLNMAGWLAPPPNQDEQDRRRRMARARHDYITKRNEPIKKKRNLAKAI